MFQAGVRSRHAISIFASARVYVVVRQERTAAQSNRPFDFIVVRFLLSSRRLVNQDQ